MSSPHQRALRPLYLLAAASIAFGLLCLAGAVICAGIFHFSDSPWAWDTMFLLLQAGGYIAGAITGSVLFVATVVSLFFDRS